MVSIYVLGQRVLDLVEIIHRAGFIHNNISLDKPEIIIGKKGVFYRWMKKRNKLGGQNKIPRLSNSREYIEELLKLNI